MTTRHTDKLGFCHEEEAFTFETHQAEGRRIKQCLEGLEIHKAFVARQYPKSSKAEIRLLEKLIKDIRAVQSLMNQRVSREFEEKSDAELLMTYLGRLPEQRPSR
jgi:hypothetical protein